MYKFPEGFYVDVRKEKVFETAIRVTQDELEEMKEKSYDAAFIRVYDGTRWYYSAISNLDEIQNEIDKLTKIATPDKSITENPLVKKFEVNTGVELKFTGDKDISAVSAKEKLELMQSYFPLLRDRECLSLWRVDYIDKRVEKRIISSKGTDITFDQQRTGFRVVFELSEGDEQFRSSYDGSGNNIEDVKGHSKAIKEEYQRALDFLKTAEPVEPGEYPVILSPMAAGVFAHESFGHKSEADFMLGDESMKAEWEIGKEVGSEILSIIESGKIDGSGYVPYDDEGTKAKETYLVREGKLDGRLHSAITATALEEDLTGNARSISFEYEPIVRMTTTYIDKGEKTKEELISEIDNGILVDTIKHGSGMSTFTIAPALAYKIENGKIVKPVKVSVVTGTVFQALNDIDGLSNEVELKSFTLGGCGKMEQFPLPVGFGGPWVRVKSLNVQ